MSKLKILFITPQLPYPPISGGVIKSWKMVEFLSKHFDLVLGCFLKGEDDRYLEDFINKLDLKFFFYESLNKERNISNYIKSILSNKPFPVYRNWSPTFKEKVSSVLEEYKIDVILVDHFLMFQYVPENFDGKLILHEHNAEYILWKRFAKNEKNVLKKIIAYIESFRIKTYERTICNLADKVLCVVSKDIENLAKIGVRKDKLELVMSLGDEDLLKREDLKFENTEEALLFIGTLTWEANVDGLIWFIENAWDKLKEKIPSIKFYIVGKNPPKKLEDLSRIYNDIILTGFVEDLEEYYKKSRVFISPLRFGSGIKIKNLNAMYRGIPLVTTPIGAEGIEGVDGIHFMVGNTADELIDKTVILMKNKEKWTEISQNARRLMKEKYSWEIALNKLKKIISE